MIKTKNIIAGLALTLAFGAGAALTSNVVTAAADELGVAPIAVSNLTSLTMDSGASVRCDDAYATSGIRYTFTLDKSEYDALNEYGYDEITYGVFIAPEYYHQKYALNEQKNVTGIYYWKQDDGTFNVTNTAGKIRIGNAYGSQMQLKDDKTMVYTGSIVNMRNENLKADYIGVGYVKAVKGAETVYKFATLNDNVRSVATVAKAAYNANNATNDLKASLQSMYFDKITYTLSFKANDGEDGNLDVSKTLTEKVFNEVTLPELDSEGEKYSVDYYTDGEKQYKVGEKIKLEDDVVLTAVSYKSGIETNEEFIAIGQTNKPDGTEVVKKYKLLNDLTFNDTDKVMSYFKNVLDGNGKTITVNSSTSDDGKGFISQIWGEIKNLNYVANVKNVRPGSRMFSAYIVGNVNNCVITVNAVNGIIGLENNTADTDDFKKYSIDKDNGSSVLGYVEGNVKDTIIILNAKHNDGTTDFAEPYHVLSGGNFNNVVVFTSAQRTLNAVGGKVEAVSGVVRLGEMKTSHQLLSAQSVTLVDTAEVEGYSVEFSTDSDVVTINGNSATACKAGTANVVCTVKNGETVVGKVNITITVGGVNLGTAITDENDFISKMTTAGKYYLTRDLTFTNSHYYTNQAYVLKNVEGVTLNGNGHKITYTLNDGDGIELKQGACFINYTENVNISNVNFVISGTVTSKSTAFIKSTSNTVIDNCIFDIDLTNGIFSVTNAGITSSVGGLFMTMDANSKVTNCIVDFKVVNDQNQTVTYYSAIAASATIGKFENVVVVTDAARHLYTEYTEEYNEGNVHDTLDGVARVTDIKDADVSKFDSAFWAFGENNAPSFKENPYGV